MGSRRGLYFVLYIILCLVFAGNCFANQKVISHKVDIAPIVDGVENDLQWQDASPTQTYDPIAGITIDIKSVYTDEQVYFLIKFPDNEESRIHRRWHWDEDQGMYVEGADREDIFILKWAMDPATKDISLNTDVPYNADIWYWKASRTDPVGYADDKMQIFSKFPDKNVQEISLADGSSMYLKRFGDIGTSSYKTKIHLGYKEDVMPRYTILEPTGSRADVRAKGEWADGVWTVEFSRKLETNNIDDIALISGTSYLFGVSRYEIAGRAPNHKIGQPLFGSGDITEPLYLEFQ